MTIRRCVHVALVLGAALFLMAASASASTINYYTTGTFVAAPGLNITNGGLTDNGSFGVAATITFTPNTTTGAGTPTNVNLGDFQLTCASCGTQTSGNGAFFRAFTFQLTVNDTTDGAVGYFLGTAAQGNIYSDASSLSIAWGSLITTSGSFGGTSFVIYTPTPIVAQNSGTPAGDTTVQAYVTSTSSVPEPATLGLIGGGLLGLGVVLRRKKRA
jgi:hypothetical protein